MSNYRLGSYQLYREFMYCLHNTLTFPYVSKNFVFLGRAWIFGSQKNADEPNLRIPGFFYPYTDWTMLFCYFLILVGDAIDVMKKLKKGISTDQQKIDN